jgi:hypothetical protein
LARGSVASNPTGAPGADAHRGCAEKEKRMAAHEFESARAKRGRRAAPPRNDLVRRRRSGRLRTRGDRLLVWAFSASMLVAAAGLAAGAYWGYRQMQPRPLYAPASVDPEHGPAVQPPPVATPAPAPTGRRIPAGWE